MLEVSKTPLMQSNNPISVIPTASRIRSHSQPKCDSVSFGRALPKPANVVIGAVTEHQKEQVEMIKRTFSKRLLEAEYRCNPDGRVKVVIKKVITRTPTSNWLGLPKWRIEIEEATQSNSWSGKYLNGSLIGLDSRSSSLMHQIRDEKNIKQLAANLYDFLLIFRVKPVIDEDMKATLSALYEKPDFLPVTLDNKIFKPKGSNAYGSFLSIGPDSMALFPVSKLHPSMRKKIGEAFEKGFGRFTVRNGKDTYELKREMLEGKEHIRVTKVKIAPKSSVLDRIRQRLGLN